MARWVDCSLAVLAAKGEVSDEMVGWSDLSFGCQHQLVSSAGERWGGEREERGEGEERKGKCENEIFEFETQIYKASKVFVKVSVLIPELYICLKVDSIL